MYRLYDPKTNGFALAEFNPNASTKHMHITIKPGSQLAANEVKSGFIANQRSVLLKEGKIVLRNNFYVVLNDVSFSSSGSAAMIMGRHPGSGADRWEHIQTGKSLRMISDEQGMQFEDEEAEIEG
ncbi:protein of unknown function [Paenibacillus polysaccharolyticus]|uniref:DUF4357 domain-containing protein n=1 Tax=Paenibacillus polysaccharolyticus TaxID=582692 RepID=A0A1G5ASQ8_9BACL|nr:DUF4357 domain-containing protein [Paenibacillus polysaccharolyticus]SCX80933.1 protein of unknown function [Paenibacillus polysaccharolyticus]